MRFAVEISIKMDDPHAEIMEIAKAVSEKLANSPLTSEMGIKILNFLKVLLELLKSQFTFLIPIFRL